MDPFVTSSAPDSSQKFVPRIRENLKNLVRLPVVDRLGWCQSFPGRIFEWSEIMENPCTTYSIFAANLIGGSYFFQIQKFKITCNTGFLGICGQNFFNVWLLQKVTLNLRAFILKVLRGKFKFNGCLVSQNFSIYILILLISLFCLSSFTPRNFKINEEIQQIFLNKLLNLTESQSSMTSKTLWRFHDIHWSSSINIKLETFLQRNHCWYIVA